MKPQLPRLNDRALTVFLIVGLPLLAVAGVLALGSGQAKLRESYGNHLAEAAGQTAAAIDTYFYRRIIDASVFARVPEIRAAAAAGSREPYDAARAQQIDQAWARAGEPLPELSSILSTSVSTFLSDVAREDPIYRELLLTDRHGRLIAASSRTTDYYQADEDWWRDAFADGVRGRLSVGDVRWDQSAKVHALEIAVPVAEPSSERLAGVLKVITDIREVAALVGDVGLGASGDAALVRENGSIVIGSGPLGASAQFFAADLLRERIQAARRGDPEYRDWFRARGGDREGRVVGVAPSQLGSSYPNLAWLVAVSQTEDELFAPIRSQAASLVLMLAVTALAVLACALWFSMRLSAPRTELDMHLVEHARIPRFDEPTTPPS